VHVAAGEAILLVEELIAEEVPRGEPPKHLRVMIVAENASFSQGGASFLAVQWFRHLLREGVDVHLLVHARSKPELDQSLSRFSSRIHYVPEVLLQTVFWKVGNATLPPHVRDFTSGWVVHLITQFMQRRLARRLIEQYKIDVVHEPTPVTPRLPSMMYGLGIPVVIGPMNGNMIYPPAYRSSRSLAERAFVPIGRAFAGLANHLIPGKRRADVLLVANERTRLALPAGYAGRVVVLCENGVDPDVWRRPDDLPARGADQLRMAFLGRLVDWKGVDLALEVFAKVKAQMPSAELWIMGDGPALPRLRRQAERLGLADAVTFHGWVSPEDSPRLLSQTDILLYPSVFDCGGAVVLEAMALGLTVVALNWGGPGDYLAAGGGVLVDPVGRRQAVAELTKAVLDLTPTKRRKLGGEAQRRIAEQYTWPAKVRQIIGVYQSVCKLPEAATSGGASWRR
jgi:glycosyltransferase involved in cell wall biosynthesis